jgi:O-antigen/teichoic acid export membrane protein
MLLGMVTLQADRLMINAFLTLEALGLYALAMKFSGLIEQLIGEPFNRSYGAFRFSVMDRPDAGEMQARIVRYLCAGAVCFGLGLALFTTDLLAVIAQPSYWPAGDILPLLVVAALLNVLVYPLQTGILFRKKTGDIFQINLVAALFCLPANFLLIRGYGIAGACVAQILTAALVAALTWRKSNRYFPVAYPWRPLLLLTAVAGMTMIVARSLPEMPLMAAILAHTALYLSFLALLPLTGAVTSHEIGILRTWVASRLARTASP